MAEVTTNPLPCLEPAVLDPNFDVDVRPERERVLLVPRGELDHFPADALRSAVDEVVASGWRRVVIDLRELDFMDAGGVHLLEELRDGRHSEAEWPMVDGHAPVSLPIELIGGPRLLPVAQLAA